MWKALRRAVYETEGFYLRLSDDASPAQEVLLFFPHGVVALLVMIYHDAKLEQKQVRRIERFQNYAIPVYYTKSPQGVYSAVVGAAQSIDLGINYYP
ncbi:MAG: hypothetical protein IJ865_07980 [Clostridia bacterium]|nr:hypothetical protein [Clostridia bacterium]